MPATIAGSGFIPASTAQWNGAALATTYSSATTLGVTLPASNLANGTVAKLTVVNPSPGGGTSSAVDFLVNNPVPAISRINPTSVVAGSVADVRGLVAGAAMVMISPAFGPAQCRTERDDDAMMMVVVVAAVCARCRLRPGGYLSAYRR